MIFVFFVCFFLLVYETDSVVEAPSVPKAPVKRKTVQEEEILEKKARLNRHTEREREYIHHLKAQGIVKYLHDYIVYEFI